MCNICHLFFIRSNQIKKYSPEKYLEKRTHSNLPAAFARLLLPATHHTLTCWLMAISTALSSGAFETCSTLKSVVAWLAADNSASAPLAQHLAERAALLSLPRHPAGLASWATAV
jgi:hypothetical protein